MWLLGSAFIHAYIYSLNKYSFAVCQALCSPLENKNKSHVLYFLMFLQENLFHCTALILGCIIFIR